jgi:hypothetical protein
MAATAKREALSVASQAAEKLRMYGERTKFAGWKTISQASRIVPGASWCDPFLTPSEKLSFSAACSAANRRLSVATQPTGFQPVVV